MAIVGTTDPIHIRVSMKVKRGGGMWKKTMSESAANYCKICFTVIQLEDVGACINCDTLLTANEMLDHVIVVY